MRSIPLSVRWSVALPAALLALVPAAASQQQEKPKQEKPAAPHAAAQEKPAQEKPKVAEASVVVSPRAPISLTVAGLTKDNAPKVEEAIRKIVHTTYTCSHCNITLASPGNCPKCNAPLTKDTTPKSVAKTVTVDADKGMLKVALEPGQRVKLSELESSLKAQSVTLSHDQIMIPSWSGVIVAGPADAATTKKLETALVDAKTFDAVTVKTDETSKEILVIPQAANGIKLKDLTAAIDKAGLGYKYQDVVFAAPCVECTKKGMAQAACKACWETPKT